WLELESIKLSVSIDFFFFQAEDGIRDRNVTGVQTCALPIFTFNQSDYYIRIELDQENRQLIVSDTGIGMNKEELEDNLGVIAKSGSLSFKKENEIKDGYDILGQIGVGFYAAFMVADQVTVKSKAFGEDQAYKWYSEGADGFTSEPIEKESVGTEIVLSIKENTDEDDFDQFLDPNQIQTIVK